MTWDQFSLSYPAWAVVLTYLAWFLVAGGAVLAQIYGIYCVWDADRDEDHPRPAWED